MSLIFALLLCALGIKAQGFFNLTASEVRIDSLLPCFSYSKDLGYAYADSTYEVAIEYPEFIPMTKNDIRRYHLITSDSLPSMPVINSGIAVDRKRGVLDVSFVPLAMRNGVMCKLVSFKLTVKSTPTTKRTPSASRSATRETTGGASSRYADVSVLDSGMWAKIRVPSSGVYEITEALIRKAGFSDITKVKVYGYGGALVPEKLTDEYLRQHDDLQQVPICVVGNKRLFYAQGPVSWNGANRVRNTYSQYGYYFLTSNDKEALTVDSAAFIKSFYPSDEYHNTLYEVDDYAWYAGGRNLYDVTLLGASKPVDYTLPSTSSSPKGTLKVVVTADFNAMVKVSVNDSLVGTISISAPASSYDHAVSAVGNYSLANIAASNKITLENTSSSNVRLDYIILHNDKPMAAPDLTAASFPTPEYVHRITNQNLHGHTPVDMIIIIPTSQQLLSEAERLKALHEKYDSMTVRIVPADELFNEFSSGTPDASAYRRYLKMFYDRATSDKDIPSYLVLFGDGAWDNRMLSASWKGYSPDDYLLCYESENSFSATKCFVSDDFFCLLDDGETIGDESGTTSVYRGKADVAVGRFPVRSQAQAAVMVDKIEAYLGNENAGAWQNTLVFMGDDGDENVHMEDADLAAKTAEAICPSFDVRRVMWDSYKRVASSTGFGYPDVTNIIKKYMDSGTLLMNYSGHGAPYSFSHELVVKLSDFENTTSKCLPLWFTASCDIMPFDGQESTIGETAVLNSKGGAVAFYGTTRTVYSHQNRMMNLAFTKLVVDPSLHLPIGEAVRRAKNSLVDNQQDLSVNKLQYSLLGDPALKLALPRLKSVIDDINGKTVGNGDKQILKAGEMVTVSGHVEENGALAADFSGLMTAMVSDAKRTVVCRYNDPAECGDEPFVYEDYSGTVYKGTDSIKAGRFTFSFVVPKDISYSDAAGDIRVYAVNSAKTKTATGNTTDIVLNGSAEFKTDSIGPSIYCYLNSRSFANGGTVNATPFFIAEINDEDGINAAGNGIGHDMQLIIDGDPTKTYNLNDYFTYDFGSYKSGTVGFTIPNLTVGEHKLFFRAWDVLNNPSTSQLSFVVSDNVAPTLFDVQCTQNPAVTSTSFRIIHDRVGSEVNVKIEIFDMSGRHLGTHTASGTPGDTSFTVDWDLTVNGSQRLGTGVYLYRACISSGGSDYTTKTNKLIIISNK